jgi:hypothetical protein
MADKNIDVASQDVLTPDTSTIKLLGIQTVGSNLVFVKVPATDVGGGEVAAVLSPPSTGQFSIGTRLRNANPVPGGPRGWIVVGPPSDPSSWAVDGVVGGIITAQPPPTHFEILLPTPNLVVSGDCTVEAQFGSDILGYAFRTATGYLLATGTPAGGYTRFAFDSAVLAIGAQTIYGSAYTAAPNPDGTFPGTALIFTDQVAIYVARTVVAGPAPGTPVPAPTPGPTPPGVPPVTPPGTPPPVPTPPSPTPPVAFLPSQVAQTAFWYEMDDAAAEIHSAGFVSQITDKGGTHNLTESVNKPGYFATQMNGKPCARFLGTGATSISTPAAADINDMWVGGGTLLLVITPTGIGADGAGNGQIISKGTWSVEIGGANYLVFSTQWSNGFRYWAAPPSSQWTLGQTCIVSITYDSSLTTNVPSVQVNGVDHSLPLFFQPDGGTTMLSDAAYRLRLGNDNTGSAAGQFDFGSAVGFPVNPSGADYNATVSYLATKWGITTTLTPAPPAPTPSPPSPAALRTFYISSAGNDTNNGTSIATPWLTIAKVNAATKLAGDTYAFRAGDIFTDATLTITSSGTQANHIRFTNYSDSTGVSARGYTGTVRAIIDRANSGDGVDTTAAAWIDFDHIDIRNCAGPGFAPNASGTRSSHIALSYVTMTTVAGGFYAANGGTDFTCDYVDVNGTSAEAFFGNDVTGPVRITNGKIRGVGGTVTEPVQFALTNDYYVGNMDIDVSGAGSARACILSENNDKNRATGLCIIENNIFVGGNFGVALGDNHVRVRNNLFQKQGRDTGLVTAACVDIASSTQRASGSGLRPDLIDISVTANLMQNSASAIRIRGDGAFTQIIESGNYIQGCDVDYVASGAWAPKTNTLGNQFGPNTVATTVAATSVPPLIAPVGITPQSAGPAPSVPGPSPTPATGYDLPSSAIPAVTAMQGQGYSCITDYTFGSASGTLRTMSGNGSSIDLWSYFQSAYPYSNFTHNRLNDEWEYFQRVTAATQVGIDGVLDATKQTHIMNPDHLVLRASIYSLPLFNAQVARCIANTVPVDGNHPDGHYWGSWFGNTGYDCGVRSGMICQLRTWKFGYIECKMQRPDSTKTGAWDAFWQFDPLGWPPEIDMEEGAVNNAPENSFLSGHRTATNGDSRLNSTTVTGLLDQYGNYRGGYDQSAAPRLYAMEWTNDGDSRGTHVKIFVEQVKIWDGYYPWNHNDPQFSVGNPAQVVIDLAFGGDWPGRGGACSHSDVFPIDLKVYYLRTFVKG